MVLALLTILRDGVSSQTLTFAATLLDITNNLSLINLGYVIVEANWGGKKRWAYIALLHRNHSVTSHFGFNRSLYGSVWFPGTDIVPRRRRPEH
jgi:hypothetical protein